jgi:hypothetical protein
VAAVDEEKSTWTRYDLARQLTLTLAAEPTTDGPALLARVDELVERAVGAHCGRLGVVKLTAPAVVEVPEELRRRSDGISVYDNHGAARFSTDDGLAREIRVLAP